MSIPVRCPHCRGEFQIADKFAGSKIRCPKCKAGVIEVADVSAAQASVQSDELRLRPVDAGSTADVSEPPLLRSRMASRRRTRTLLMVGGSLLGVIVLIGGLAIAGSYAWGIASQAKVLTLAPTVEPISPIADSASLESVAENSLNVAEENENHVGANPDMVDPKQWQTFRPQAYPIELNFPAGVIQQEQIAGLEQFRWETPSGYDVSRGVFTEVKLIIVPRADNQTDIAAIENAKQRVRPLPLDESQFRHPRERNTTFSGRPAFTVMFEMPARRTRNFGAYIADREQVYVVLAMADANILPHKWQEIVQSIRFPSVVAEVPLVKAEPPKVAASPKPQSTMPEPPKAASRTRSILGLPPNAADVAAFWSGGVKMRSSLHPFEIEYPSSQVIAFPKSPNEDGKKTAVHYLQRLDAGLVDGELILTNDLTRFFATVISVRVGPRTDDKTDEELVKSLIDRVSLSNKQGALMEAKETRHEGFTAVDMASAIESDIAGLVVFERARFIFHPTGIYVIIVQGKKASAGGDRFINSFHFVDEPGKLGDGSRLIPVAVFAGSQPTRRNLTGQEDPNGRYVLWEDIPVQ